MILNSMERESYGGKATEERVNHLGIWVFGEREKEGEKDIRA